MSNMEATSIKHSGIGSSVIINKVKQNQQFFFLLKEKERIKGTEAVK